MHSLLFLFSLVSVVFCIMDRQSSLRALSGLSNLPADDCVVSSIASGSTTILNTCSFAIEAYVHCRTAKGVVFKEVQRLDGCLENVVLFEKRANWIF